MFEKYNDIERIGKEYAQEQVELNDTENELEKIEAERDQVIAQQKQLEEEERNEKLWQIRRTMAAKVIQRYYRSYKARMMLKKKRRKKKKGDWNDLQVLFKFGYKGASLSISYLLTKNIKVILALFITWKSCSSGNLGK